ncbi:hypothetical protein N657DRAFT_653952 [Parathielavia appendiculata]|uniref:Uncharacterized protein n=1 Tax=Parathielavia appendiculata TaxID=2587402 RepID=A0AAN6Z7V0_9PEZI|nr:hypothetical protein N657DRAFT_653952 [Parathielavia appendiculata]
MSPHIRIVVRDRELLASAMPVKPVATAKAALSPQPPRSKRGDLAMLRQGVDIALEYFNSDDSVPISELTPKARDWADRYVNGDPYAAKRPTALLRTFPNLFNFEVEAHLRLRPAVMSPPSSPEPESASPRGLRRAERRFMNSGTFPEFAEPTLASDSEMDQIVDLRCRRPEPAAKPTMRVDAAMLRGSGLMSTLPEFLGQLARANLETETMLANNPDAVRLELDDDQAASQQHIEMNLFSGLVEAQRRRRQPRVLLPNDLAVKLPDTTGNSSEHENSEEEDSTEVEESAGGKRIPSPKSFNEDSGDESDASTSTTASLQTHLRKRKAAESEDDGGPETASPPNKTRLHYHYPPSELRHYDTKRRKLVTCSNPAAVPDDPSATPIEELPSDPAATNKNNNDNRHNHESDNSITVASRPTSSGSSTSNNSSSAASRRPVPVTKIRLPSRSPGGSRSASPDRIIVLRHPVVSSSSRESSVEPAGPSGSGSPARRSKIRVVQKEGLGEGTQGKRRQLIEEVE